MRTNSPPDVGSNNWGRDMGSRREDSSVPPLDKMDPGLDITDFDRQAKAKHVFVPRPRRVTSPELIFRGASLDRCEKEELCSFNEESVDMDVECGDKWNFRSIGRPDVNLDTPPTRAGNPVIMDERFHEHSNVSSSMLYRPIARPMTAMPNAERVAWWNAASS
ncbi:hypothetical protein H257_00696 [Aphanomyces astaci]|uniref:Uncharacterized protein n=1 Tax=Aphanomyces astaci TaxID=112090 RepID=W4HDK7_APHAT|nr:hypothetical protein H257_00696 [Aphanomyces astaci]ETV89404.1 hypothetical protein H257_00696 [Aphanomyces astaci]|eukprot:XP_009821804.1 hypothetical protein H257_00696 [Aphanomyces astaci]